MTLTPAGLQRHQVAVGLGLGLFPGVGGAEAAVLPVLAALLFVTFLEVPVARVIEGLRDRRFLLALVVLDFVLLPLGVFGLSRFVAHDAALLVGVLSVTRNALVVLPLALALDSPVAPAAIVLQTLVELLLLVAAVRLVPLLVPARGVSGRAASG